jgi:hypothetical protein
LIAFTIGSGIRFLASGVTEAHQLAADMAVARRTLQAATNAFLGSFLTIS